jgi:hypothetical protein
LLQIARQSTNPSDRKLAQDALVDFEKTDMQPIFSGTVPGGIFQETAWLSLAAPDPRFGPGTIFELESGAPRWLSSLRQCKVPNSLLKPLLTSFRGGGGSSDEISYKIKTDYAPSSVLLVPGVSAGPQFNKAASAKLFVSPETGTSVVNVTNLKFWFSQHSDLVSSDCKKLLSRPDVYVAYESYRMDNAEYTLQDSSGSDINISTTGALELSTNADAKVAKSSLLVTTPVYIAVRPTHIYKTASSTR